MDKTIQLQWKKRENSEMLLVLVYVGMRCKHPLYSAKTEMEIKKNV